VSATTQSSRVSRAFHTLPKAQTPTPSIGSKWANVRASDALYGAVLSLTRLKLPPQAGQWTLLRSPSSDKLIGSR
jgi:hypothetical protein